MRTRKRKTVAAAGQGEIAFDPVAVLQELEAKAETGVDVLELIGGATAARFRQAFSMMEIGEELLAAQWPKKVREPRPAFKFMCPSQPVRISTMLYRAHAEELVARLAKLDPDASTWTLADWMTIAKLTRGEVLGLLAAASLRHPLQHRDAVMYESIFRDLFPAAKLGLEDFHIGGAAGAAENAESVREWLERLSPEREAEVNELRAEYARKNGSRRARASVSP